MALRNQPYLPLYVQDFMTDEKLNECSAAANGIYIRLMCLMHKSENYGQILLKQKYKQNESKISDLLKQNFKQSFKQVLFFAYQLEKNMPFSVEEIASGLEELLREEVVQIEDDVLYQKRMVNDGMLSDKRASAGSRGGKQSILLKQNCKQNSSKVSSKIQANSENEIEYEYENEIENNNKNIIDENFKNFDPYDYKANEKYFKIYEEECSELVKLGFEKRDNKTFVALAEFRNTTQDDVEYFRTVCKKANAQQVICGNKIDFRSILNNHIRIFGETYNKEERGENGFEY